MLSRVQEIDQVYLIDDFDPNKIYPSVKALKELERMNSVSLNKNPSPWNNPNTSATKIMFMNCAGLEAHYEDIKIDYKIRHADLISLLEISLPNESEDKAYELSGYSESFIKRGPGKGIVGFYKNDKFSKTDMISTDKYQVIKFQHNMMDIISLYRSQIGNSTLLMEDLHKLIDLNRITLVIGDLNACYRENFSNKVIQGLKKIGFAQMIHDPTHIRGRIIDHTYLLDPAKRLEISIERYSPYYTDHDAICLSIEDQSKDAKQNLTDEQ